MPGIEPRRVVVSGIGAVSAFGWGTEVLRRGLHSGRTAIGIPKRFDTTGQRTHLVAEVPEPPEDAPRISRWETLSRADQFAVFAAREAISMAGIDPAGPETGVFFGGSTAGMTECEEWVGRILGLNPGSPRLALLASQQLNGPGDAVARDLGIEGPVENCSSACASGAQALGSAFDAIRHGEVAIAVAGGADSLCLLTYAGFNSLRSVDPEPCRPFRAGRQGLSLGEGAGTLILEDVRNVLERGGSPLAEIIGFAAGCDAHHMTAPHPEGDGALAVMEAALSDAGLAWSDVSAINAHGTGTPHNDDAEASALRRLTSSDPCPIPLTAPKEFFGHVLGAAGAMEAVVTVLGIEDRTIGRAPSPEPADSSLGIDLVTDCSRLIDRKPPVWLSVNFAFGGANAAVVLRGWEEGGGAS